MEEKMDYLLHVFSKGISYYKQEYHKNKIEAQKSVRKRLYESDNFDKIPIEHIISVRIYEANDKGYYSFVSTEIGNK